MVSQNRSRFHRLFATRPMLLPAVGLAGLFATSGLAAAAPAVAEGDATMVRYEGHRLVRVFVPSVWDWDRMMNISSDAWNCHLAINGWNDFRVAPDRLADLEALGLPFEVLHDDVQTMIDEFDLAQQTALERLAGRPAEEGDGLGVDDENDNVWYEAYHPWNDVNTYVDSLIARRPDLAERVRVGDSVEGREIYAVRIGGSSPKAAVLYHGLQHAREWITVPTMVYMVEQLIDGYGVDPGLTDLLNEVEFYIVPVVNPDGYVYTWERDRLWRKNRQGTYGVDLNRNWAVGWGGPGSGGFRFLDNYRGPSPFSEPETQALRDFMLARPELRAHIDFHSYSQLIMHSWGFTENLCRDHDDLYAIAGEMSAIVRSVHGKVYDFGPVATTIYLASGGANDWTYGAADMLGYAYELRDEGQFGFLLPPDQILPTCEEIFPAAVHLAEEARALPPRMLLEAEPLVPGTAADLQVINAGPNTDVYFVYSLAGTGWTPVAALGHGIGLSSPSLLGSERTNGTGGAILTANIPSGAPSVPVWLQAVRVGDESNIVATRVTN